MADGVAIQQHGNALRASAAKKASAYGAASSRSMRHHISMKAAASKAKK